MQSQKNSLNKKHSTGGWQKQNPKVRKVYTVKEQKQKQEIHTRDRKIHSQNTNQSHSTQGMEKSIVYQ